MGATPDGYSIPCGRGGDSEDAHVDARKIQMFAGLVLIRIVPPLTILAMYRRQEFTKIERQMQHYGVRALRFRTAPAVSTANDNSTAQENEGRAGLIPKMKKLVKLFFCFTASSAGQEDINHRGFAIRCFRRPQHHQSRTTKSNQMASQKRAVLHMAAGYAGAWLLVRTPYFVSYHQRQHGSVFL